MNRKPGEKTLLISMLLSSPGPLVVGIGLVIGRSSTQLADFIRRTAELGAIIISYVLYRILYRDGEPASEAKIKSELLANRSVGGAMMLSGLGMLLIAFLSVGEGKGNVLPGFLIAVAGTITNTIFWIRYSGLNRKTPDGILEAQSKLYCGKTLVDTVVMITLFVLMIWPQSRAASITDLIGSTVVALYLVVTGISTWNKKGMEEKAIQEDPT